MSLPIPWVEKIFKKLTVGYGVEFMNRYKGVPLVDVKTDWSEELSGFGGDAITYALEHLPDRAPTAMQFKALCILCPAPEAPRLEAPAVGRERVAAELAKFEPIRAMPGVYDFKAWARTIVAEHGAGVRKSPTVIQMARNALGVA